MPNFSRVARQLTRLPQAFELDSFAKIVAKPPILDVPEDSGQTPDKILK